ncbi:hypothetical protein NT6N_27930 [Oceaniferula spumae]|uniref:Phospholipase/carboxylesterase/thioesterase domain-containing protein n=1 Tax=Oceaniferula spumae TaxID=2979115 RepID=A0AAT9FP85_9BACT
MGEMEKATLEKDGNSLPYQWTRTGDGDSPSLVLFLHGAGERGNNNRSQVRHGVPDLLKWLKQKKEDCVVVAPQCPTEKWWSHSDGDFRNSAVLTMRKNPSPPMEMVFTVLDQLVKKHGVDPSRIYITGLSMGGYGSFDAVARRPDFFAAAIPICGGGDSKTAEKMKDVPMWIFHGDADNVVPVGMSQAMVKALKKAGATPKYTEYPGVGHNSWSQTYRNPEVWAWMFSQKKK